MAESDADQKGLVPIGQAARLLGISEERIRQLQKAGYVEKGPHGRVSLVSAVQGYIKSLKDDIAQARGSGAENKVRDLKAREIEQRLKVKEGNLIENDKAIALVDLICGSLRSEMSGLAAGVTRDRELRNRIQDRIDGAFTRAAKRLDAYRSSGTITEG